MKAPYILCHFLGCVILLEISNQALAVPDAGQLLQQQQKQSSTFKKDLSVELVPTTTNPSHLHVTVREIKIIGHHCFSTAQLQQLVADVIGQELNLKQLSQVAQRITNYYQQHGYGYSRAYLPQQNLSQGIVQINVLEAHYDQINLKNNSRIQNRLLEKILAPLKQGEQIDNFQMQQQLKLLNHLSGVNTRHVLTPGASVGSSRLNINVENSALFTGYLAEDNYGNEYTHNLRTTAGISINNPIGWGDVLSLEFLSTGQYLNSAKASYAFTLNGLGTRLGLSHSYLDYQLVGELESIGATGNATQSSIVLSQPLLLNNTAEVFLAVQYDHKHLEDDIQLIQYKKHRDIEAVTIRLEGSRFDRILNTGLTQYGVSTVYGQVKYKNAAAAVIDEQGAHTAGDYFITRFYLSRLQHIGDRGTQAYVGLSAQLSADNLDSAEQYLLGGPFHIRAYPISQFSGSSGYLTTAELRQRLFKNAKHQLVGTLFVDHAGVILNASPWSGVTGKNQLHISGVGLGLNWRHHAGYHLQSSIAFPFGAIPQQLNSRDNYQYWLSIQKSF